MRKLFLAVAFCLAARPAKRLSSRLVRQPAWSLEPWLAGPSEPLWVALPAPL